MEKNVQRTNVFDGEFSPSGVDTARCMRKFYYTKILGLTPITPNVALTYGICIHHAVEKFWHLKTQGMPLQELREAVVKEFVGKWQEFNIIGDKKRSLEGGMITMNAYAERYFHDMDEFELADIETDQWVRMPNGTMMLVKMDRVLNKDSQIALVDTKTTSSGITDWYFKQFDNHLPTSLYHYTVSELLGHCDYIMIDAIKVPHPPPTSSSAPFGRQTFFRTDLQMIDALSTYCKTTDYIINVLNDVPEQEWPEQFYCNQGECDKWSGCPFLGICKHGLDHPSVQIDFTVEKSNNKKEN